MGGISFLILVLTNIHIWIKRQKNKKTVYQININLPIEDNVSEHQVPAYNNSRYNKEIIGTVGFVLGALLFLMTMSTWVNGHKHHIIALMYAQDVGPSIIITFILPLCLYAKKKDLRKFVSDCIYDFCV
jgi:hypothetical protein